MTRNPRSPENATLAIIESDARLAERLTRVLAAAARFPRTVCVSSAQHLREQCDSETRVIACSSQRLGELVHVLDEPFRQTCLVVWTASPDREIFEIAARLPFLVSVIAWPDGKAVPRLWELALPIRRLLGGHTKPLETRDCLQWEGGRHEWLPRSTADLRATLDELEGHLDKLGVPKRTARRIVSVGHELLMNALYDAPEDVHGRKLYAHDRTQDVSLDPRDSPYFALATDGMSLVLQASDRFGGLSRDDVYGSILRGFRSRDADATQNEILHTAGGGAGLGIHRIVFQASATVFDVQPGWATVVTALFDLEQANRDLRTSPKSLHIFRTAHDAR